MLQCYRNMITIVPIDQIERRKIMANEKQMEGMKFENKKNGKIGVVVEEHPGSVIMEFSDGTNSAVSKGTLKRWYKKLNDSVSIDKKEESKKMKPVDEEVVDEEVTEEVDEAVEEDAVDDTVERITYEELVELFVEHNKEKKRGKKPLKAHIVFTQDSFDEEYTEEERTYRVTSNNNGFKPDKEDGTIFIDAIDGTDNGVRLDWYDWDVEYCVLVK